MSRTANGDQDITIPVVKPILDKWDNAVIFYLKQDLNCNMEGVRKIWAERCGMDIRYITTQCLVDHFLPIVLDLGKVNKDLTYSAPWIINDASPDKAWQFRDMGEQTGDETTAYYNRILTVICSRLRLSEVKYLPGFSEYFKQRKANMVLV